MAVNHRTLRRFGRLDRIRTKSTCAPHVRRPEPSSSPRPSFQIDAQISKRRQTRSPLPDGPEAELSIVPVRPLPLIAMRRPHGDPGVTLPAVPWHLSISRAISRERVLENRRNCSLIIAHATRSVGGNLGDFPPGRIGLRPRTPPGPKLPQRTGVVRIDRPIDRR